MKVFCMLSIRKATDFVDKFLFALPQAPHSPSVRFALLRRSLVEDYSELFNAIHRILLSLSLTSFPEIWSMTNCSNMHESVYASISPSRFCALSVETAVFALCSACESRFILSISLRPLR